VFQLTSASGSSQEWATLLLAQTHRGLDTDQLKRFRHDEFITRALQLNGSVKVPGFFVAVRKIAGLY
jgi:hypothetical protein